MSVGASQSETSQLNYTTGQTPNLSSGTGTVGFPQNKFTQPPIVIASAISSNNFPPNVCIRNVTKDYFTYYYNGVQRPGDKLNWLAIGS